MHLAIANPVTSPAAGLNPLVKISKSIARLGKTAPVVRDIVIRSITPATTGRIAISRALGAFGFLTWAASGA
jgi:hypothetical protein